MKTSAFLALVAASLMAVACGSSSSQSSSSQEPAPTVTTPPEPAPTTAPTAATDKPLDEPLAEPHQGEPDTSKPSGGRLAFTACTPESRKGAGCTKDLKPVCGQVDTGIRCIKAPCPSTEARTFSNGCLACQDAKVQGYFPMSCEDMNSGKAP